MASGEEPYDPRTDPGSYLHSGLPFFVDPAWANRTIDFGTLPLSEGDNGDPWGPGNAPYGEDLRAFSKGGREYVRVGRADWLSPELQNLARQMGFDPIPEKDAEAGYIAPKELVQALQGARKAENSEGWSGALPMLFGAAALGGVVSLGASGVAGAEAAGGAGFGVDSPYWRMLADAGGAVSDVGGALGAEVTLPTVNVVDTAIPQLTGGGFLPAAGGGVAAALLAAGFLPSGATADPNGFQTPANVSPERAAQFSDSFKEMATREGWSMEQIGEYLKNPTIRTLLSSAAQLGSAAFGANAAGNAADAQIGASRDAIAEQRRQFDQTRADNAPFLATGTAANQRLRQLLGLDPAYGGADSGSLTRKFTQEDMEHDPVYSSSLHFGMDEGRKAIDARAIAGGTYDSGGTLKALTKYGIDYASTKGSEAFNRYASGNSDIYNRLAGVSGAGQVAANQVATAGTNATNAISNNITDAGNARAASIVGGANSWSQAAQGISNTLNNYTSNDILERLLRSRGY